MSDAFSTCQSPTDLMALANVESPSTAVETALDGIYATQPTRAQHAQWRELSRMPWPTTRPRRVVACIGRRGLKTSGLLAWSCVFETLCVAHDAHAAEGSRIFAVVVAPRQAQAREAVRAIVTALEQLAPLGVRFEMRGLAQAPEIVITAPRGRCERVITILTADSVSVRGRAIYFFGADEAGFWASEEWLAERDRDVVRAIVAGQVQFPAARQFYVSSPGRPGSYFHELVEKPPKGAVVLRAATWTMNPRVSRERCLADAGGDFELFAQEYEASRFGYGGESFIPGDAVCACLGSVYAGLGPRPGRFAIGLDFAALHDDSAIVVTSSFGVEIAPHVAPVRHVVVERVEIVRSSRKEPTPVEAMAARVAQLSSLYNDAPIVFDQFCAPEMKRHLVKLGFTEHLDDSTVPPPRSFAQKSMSPQHQTPRWRLLRELVVGRRLHLAAEHEALAQQLSQLRAVQQSSGALKVEGRKDDAADALALSADVAVRLAPLGGPDGHVEFKWDGMHFEPGRGLELIGGRWVRTLPTGGEVLTETPEWSAAFEPYAREMVAQGIWTPAIRRWFERQPPHVQREINPTHAVASTSINTRVLDQH